MRMLFLERQQQILDLLKLRQCVMVEQLCRELSASGATIRRDLSEMEEKGLLRRVRGGAVSLEGRNSDASPLVRSHKNVAQKRIIARMALAYIRDSMTIFLDSSSTVSFLAEELRGFRNLSVVTNGIDTANILNERTAAKVFLCGGRVQNHSSIIGPLAQQSIRQFRADIFFFSCCGLSASAGATEASEDTAEIKRLMLTGARHRVLLCDSSKWDREYFCKSCDIADLDAVLTEQRPPAAYTVFPQIRVSDESL